MGLENERMPEARDEDDGSLVLLIALLLLTVPAAFYVNRAVPDGYMDEEFHFNQAVHYCRGDFRYWDPKITTLPGLYFASLLYAEILLPAADYFGYASALSDICSKAPILRSLNVVLLLISALLFRAISLELDGRKNPLRASLKAFVLSLYPLHWFFSLLYYTEMTSAASVMAMYLCSLQRAHWISALFGALAILFRQTNIVWVSFVLCAAVLDFLETVPLESRDFVKGDPMVSERTEAHENPASSRPLRDGIRQRRFSTEGEIQSSHDEIVGEVFGSQEGAFLGLASALRKAWLSRKALFWNFSPFLVVLFLFLSFVAKNGSIVLGDKEAHRATLHFANVLYCGLFCAGFQFTMHFNPLRVLHFFRALRESAVSHFGVSILVATALAVVAVHSFGDPHPYLLADNRHFTFYVWKDLVQAHWSLKYLAIPAYLYSWISIVAFLAEKQKPLWILAFALAVCGVLVPTPLLEFRYYNVPFYLIFLNSAELPGSKVLGTPYLGMLIQYLLVNVLTVYIFQNWTFQWPNQPGRDQRFMW